MRKPNKIFLTVFVALSAWFVPADSFAQTSMNLKQAIDIALANNSSLRSDSLEIIVSQSRNKELAGQMLPQVIYNGGTEFNPAIGSQLVPGTLAGQPNKDYVTIPFGSRYLIRTGLELSQNIY